MTDSCSLPEDDKFHMLFYPAPAMPIMWYQMLVMVLLYLLS
jgi:hypothetical protein